MIHKSRKAGTTLRRAVMIGALVAVAGCTAITRYHGFVPFPEDVAQFSVGVTSRDDVIAIAGPPTSGGVLDQDVLYYVASEFRHFGAFAPEEVSREVMAISFDETGLLRNIERFTLQDGRVVVLSRRVTDDGIRDTTFISQLLGSIGNIDAGQFLGEG